MPVQAKVAAPPGAVPPRRSPPWRAWAAAAAAAALVAAVALIPALRTVSLGPLRGTIASAVSRSTGRTLTLGTGPAVRLSLSPALVAGDVTLANAAWGSRPAMLRAKRVELRVRILPLLVGRVRVNRIVLTSPDLFLETDRSGQGNWVFHPAGGQVPPATPAGGSPLLSRLPLREVHISGAAITFRDGATGRETHLFAPTISLTPGPAAGSELELHAAVRVNGAPVTVAGMVGGGEAITGGQPFPFRLTATAAGATATLEGRIASLLRLEGVQADCSLDAPDPSALSDVVGFHLPKLPRLRVTSRVGSVEHGFALAPLRLEVGSTTLAGNATYTPGGRRPTLVADLAGARIDLPELVGGETPSRRAGEPPGTRAQRLFSTTPIPLGSLDAFDATLNLRAETLVLRRGVEAHSLAARATLEAGKLSANPLSMTLGGGRLGGHVTLAVGSPPALAVELTGDGIPLEALLGVLGIQLHSRGGATQLSTGLTARGASMHDLMADLNGTLLVVVGKGRLEAGTLKLGGDALTQVLSAINPFHKGESSTELRCAVINVPIERGVVRVDRRAGLETATLDLMASGSANLGAETLDLELHSRATQGLGVGLGSFSGAVTLHGPLARPSLALNPVHAAESTAATVGAAAATGGLSVVATRILERLFGRSPCQTALRNGPSKPPPAAEVRRR